MSGLIFFTNTWQPLSRQQPGKAQVTGTDNVKAQTHTHTPKIKFVAPPISIYLASRISKCLYILFYTHFLHKHTMRGGFIHYLTFDSSHKAPALLQKSMQTHMHTISLSCTKHTIRPYTVTPPLTPPYTPTHLQTGGSASARKPGSWLLLSSHYIPKETKCTNPPLLSVSLCTSVSSCSHCTDRFSPAAWLS